MSRKLGLFLLSAGTLVYELLLTRLFSVAQFYHFAFVAVSLALLGFGASGSLLSLFPHWVTQNSKKVSWLAAGCAVSIVGSYLLINALPFDSYAIAWDRRQFLYLILYLLSLAAPFGFSGMAVGILLASDPQRVNRTYALNLAGSAAGCLLLLPALPLLGGERTVLLAAWLALAASAVMLVDPPSKPALQNSALPRYRSRHPFNARKLFFLAALLVCTRWMTQAPEFLTLKLSPYKGLYQALLNPEAHHASSRWNAFSRVDIVESPSLRSLPGLSYTYSGDIPAQVGAAVDAGSLMPITSGDSDSSWAQALPETFAYQLRPESRALILQPGGGLAAATALANGAMQVTVVENNPLLVRAVKDDYGRFSGGLYSDSRLTISTDGVRAFTRQSGEKYDVVQLALTDPNHPVRSGAYSLGETYIYTEEALTGYFKLLARDGVLVVTRWLQTPPSETVRLFATTLEALETAGIENPAQHLAAFRSFQTGVVLVKQSPWTAGELDQLRRFCQTLRYDLVYYPGMTAGEANQYTILSEPVYYQAFSSLVLAADRKEIYRESEFEIAPPTDDRPFFFHFFKWGQAPQLLQELGRTWQPFGGAGYFVLVSLLLLACAASALFILLPLLVKGDTLRLIRRSAFPLSRTIGYFGLLGLGFMLVEISLIQQFILFLDNPTLSLVFILAAVLFISGIGSHTAKRWRLNRSLLVLAATLFLYPIFLRELFGLGLGWPLPIRLAVTLVGLAPLCFLLGIPFAGGLARLESNGGGQLIPWAWAINGSASVIASILAALLALTIGFRGVFWLGAAVYTLAWLIVSRGFTGGSTRG